MKPTVVVLVALVVALVVGLRPHGGEPRTPLVFVDTVIAGGTSRQRLLVREILAGLDAPSIARVTIRPAERRWRPFPRGAVELELDGGVAARTSIRRQWEEVLLAGVFQARSIAAGLPPLVAYRREAEALRIWGPSGWRPEPRAHRAARGEERTLARLVYRRVRAAGGRLDWIDVLRPDGLALTARIHVPDVAAFLRARLRPLLDALPGFDEGLDGVYVVVDDDHGLAAVVSEVRARSFVRSPSWSRPELHGCLASSALVSTGGARAGPAPCPP